MVLTVATFAVYGVVEATGLFKARPEQARAFSTDPTRAVTGTFDGGRLILLEDGTLWELRTNTPAYIFKQREQVLLLRGDEGEYPCKLAGRELVVEARPKTHWLEH